MKTHLHIKLERKANKEVFVTEIGTISQMNDVVAMTMRQPITYQIDSGICCVLTRWNKHRLWYTKRCVDVDALDLLYSEINTD